MITTTRYERNELTASQRMARRLHADLERKREGGAAADASAILETPADRMGYLLAGRAVFTVRNTTTGNRFTFKVTLAEKRQESDPPTWFVAVLSGPDNTTSYRYLGLIRDGAYRPNFAKTAADAPSQKAAYWLMSRVLTGIDLPTGVEMRHSGRCGRCGRLLTDPESITRGLGPECASKALH